MNCENCPHYNSINYRIQISPDHPTYYEEEVYCALIDESQLTMKDLQIKCPLKGEK